MAIQREKRRIIRIVNRFIGGEYPILVQSMTKTDTRDVRATVGQIKELEKAGCEIIRVAVLDSKAAASLSIIKEQINIPLVADIHFDWRLAIKAIEHGADKIRIGYKVICDENKVREILKSAKEKGIPIRIGVNAGSLDDEIRNKFGVGTKAMIESAMRYIQICEDNDFFNVVVSIKSSDPIETMIAYRELAKRIDFPLHLGVTNAGNTWRGSIASSIALGSLLAQGIGDTIRVSLTGHPIEEVKVGWEILKSLNIRRRGVKVISCPTCGRLKMSEVEFTKLVKEIEEILDEYGEKTRTVSIIGCAVNGPGEALKADLGIMILDKESVVLFKGKKILRKTAISNIRNAILEEL